MQSKLQQNNTHFTVCSQNYSYNGIMLLSVYIMHLAFLLWCVLVSYWQTFGIWHMNDIHRNYENICKTTMFVMHISNVPLWNVLLWTNGGRKPKGDWLIQVYLENVYCNRTGCGRGGRLLVSTEQLVITACIARMYRFWLVCVCVCPGAKNW